MPTTRLKNIAYAAALPLFAPSPRWKTQYTCTGHAMTHLKEYQRILNHRHVLGSTLLLRRGDVAATIHASVGGSIAHFATDHTIYRVASITKIATALAILRLTEQGAFTLCTPVTQLLPQAAHEPSLADVTLLHLLSHQSGLRDVPSMQAALETGATFHQVLQAPGAHVGHPGERFAYCNFGFGLLGCVIEQATGQNVASAMDSLVFHPLGMNATLDASTLDKSRIMPIRRVLSRKKCADVRVTSLGEKPLIHPDPQRHFGHTAGAMYTEAASISRMLSLIQGNGVLDGKPFLSPETIRQMTQPHACYGAISPGMYYGLGLVLLEDETLPGKILFGHQGFAYGCVDGAFGILGSNEQVVFLNGGASEQRIGRLGAVNRDVVRLAFGKELPQWT